MSLEVWLVRHGESTANQGVWSKTPHDVCLTEKGQLQAAEVAKQIILAPDLIMISPAKRAMQSAEYIIKKWHDAPVRIEPIQEYVYLDPIHFEHVSKEKRKAAVNQFWQTCDPLVNIENTESFSHFIDRVESFNRCLHRLKGFVVVVGHGQFFKAFLLGLSQNYAKTPEWMKQFREYETANPIKNGEIIKLKFNN